MWLPFTTFVQPWRPMVKTFWRPRRPMVKTLWRPNDWWRRHFDNPFYDPRLPCDYPTWHHWRPMWQHWRPWLTPSDEKDNKVTTRTTNNPNCRRGESCVMTDVTTAHNMWWPKWRPKYDLGDPNNNAWLHLTINVMTWWWPWKFLDDIWRLHLAIFIAKVESCMSCWMPNQYFFKHAKHTKAL